MLIEDKEYVDSCIGGKPWKAGKFASSLRLSLWSEHIGLDAGEVDFSSSQSYIIVVLSNRINRKSILFHVLTR